MQTLVNCLNEVIENSLWNAHRTLDEQILVFNQLGENAHEGGNNEQSEKYFDIASSIKRHRENLRQILSESIPSQIELD